MKKLTTYVLAFLLTLAAMPLGALAAPSREPERPPNVIAAGQEGGITPKSTIVYGSYLQIASNGQLLENLQIQLNKTQYILYVVELEWLVNGSWQYYETSYSNYESTNLIMW
ncbi:hypothetical protein LJC27_08400 [Christensenellaceae bacterium OttesenSCG-928-M15]|nr:hypothetical protein [Christensenellaceae bacterium OttesenSCG-928-M15]